MSKIVPRKLQAKYYFCPFQLDPRSRPRACMEDSCQVWDEDNDRCSLRKL